MEMLNVLYRFLIVWTSMFPIAAQGNIANCSDPLGLSTNQISDDSLFATTWQPGRSDPWYGRLNNESRRSWCSVVSDNNQYIQVDLGPNLRRITAVASQGSHNYDEWVTKYKLSYSSDGGKWNFFKDLELDTAKIFDANNDRGTAVKHQIEPPISAVALRFHPIAWSGDMCMRVEAFGCDAFSEALGVENNSIIQDEYLSASHDNWNLYARYGRLNNIGKAWAAIERDREPGTFLQISIGRQLSVITAVATQGHDKGSFKAWVLTYKLRFSAWGDEWMDYTDDGKVKVFPGNNDVNTVVKHYLRHNITAMIIRFFPETYVSYPALRVEVYGGKAVCQEPLGVENGDLPDLHFTASSDEGPEKVPWKSRLNNAQAAWCAGETDNKQYLQVDLGRVRTVSSVATQGHPVSPFWVKSYVLAYSLDGIFWRNALDESKSMSLDGNTDQNTVKEVSLYKHVTARFLRFRPEAWNEGICMRIEIYGCEECAHPIGLERGVVPNEAFSASSWYDVDHEPWLARLYSREGEGAWCALENDGAQYLQVDLAQTHIITGVATQGKYEVSQWAIRFRAWVTNYSLSFTDDQMTWIHYAEDGNSPKIFDGNSQSNQVVRHTLLKRIISRHLRFLPVTWSGWTCMRVEIFGCRACSSALGMEDYHIPDSSILSTSHWGGYFAYRGRLFRSTYSWMGTTTDRNAFLQITVGITDHVITAVATQGHQTYKMAVVKFQLSFSSDGLHWFDYREDSDVRIFTSTPLTNTVTKHFLRQNVTARFVRFWPKEWFGRRNMRVEVYGCEVCTRSIDACNLNGNVEHPNIFTYDGSVLTPWQGSLKINDESPESSWCADSNDANKIQFLQLDFKVVKVIQAIAIQSHSSEDKYVREFTISSSLDGIFWKQYTEGEGVLKVFEGNTYLHTVVNVNIKYNLRARYLRIYPTAWMNHPCLRLEVFSKEDCSDPLGMENGQISDEVITASSALRVNYEPWLARLHSQLGEGAWCAGKNSENQYLQVDLQHLHHVKRVATQGKYPVPGCIAPDAWVTSYTMQFRQDTMDWWNYTEDGKARVFSGNSNTSGVVTHDLRNPVIARYVRFRPINWFNRICMRFEIYGCKACFQPLGMEDFSIPKKNVDSNVLQNIFNTRLNFDERNQFVGGRQEVTLQVNLGKFKIVTAVATQGRNRGTSFVRSYRLAFSRQEGEWFYYKENGEVKDMQGNTSPDVTALNVLQHQVITRYVRFVLIDWVESTSIRVEIYGCETRSDPLGIAAGVVSDSNLTSSSHLGPGNEPWMARLNVVPDTTAWCAAPFDPSPYLQIDLGRVVVVTQVAVAGKSGEGMVTTFKLSSSNEGGFWRKYATVLGEEVFTAAVDYSQAFKYTLALEIKARFFRFLPETWTDSPCMSVELYGYEECTWPLGLKEWIIPNEALSASSSLSTNYLPWMGRLGAKVGAGAWCAKSNDNAQYLQIDLGHVNQIRSLGIQGKEGVSRHPTVESAWVKNFTVSYSVDGLTWTDHEEDGVSKVFLGNSNPHVVRFVSLGVAIYGRHVRIFPQGWHQHICMRLELYGCQVCEDPLGTENHELPDYALLATAPHYDAKGIRLHKSDPFLLEPQVDEYVQVDLGTGGKTVTAVTIEGRFTSSNKDWITKFVLNYSRDGCEFSSYMENGAVKTFQTPPENYMFPSKHRLQHNITARYIRVLLKDWIKRPQITMELYGCEACSESHGIGNDAIRVSSSSASSSRPSHEPEKAQLLSHTGSWCAAQENEDQALQLDFGETMMLTGVATQGHHSNDEYVSKYTLEYSLDGAIWFEYIQSTANNINELDANTDSSSINKIKFLYEVKARYLRIVAKLWHNGICLRVRVFGYKGCDEDLGMENSKIPSSSINASSYLGEGYEPWNARYNRHHGSGAWCARDNVPDEFIQVQLTRVHVISRVALQRKAKISPDDAVEKAWVTKFVVAYSEDGSTWSYYSEGSGVKEFVGHGNKRYSLANTVHARFVRVVVKEWTNHVCLRMELYGCQACMEPLGLENFQIPDDSIAISSEVRSKDRIRLGYYKGNMWCARNNDLNQFVKIDLGKRKTITAIATQGNAFDLRDARLKEYYLEYSDDDSNWQEYTHKGQRKIFQGYKTQADIRREFLPQPIQARYIKLRVTHWYNYICTKLEIYGCEA